MVDERTLHCPGGHLITVKLWPECVGGERVTHVAVHSKVPWCELCQETILLLRRDPEALAEAPEQPE
jgi:hypothetical protein